MTTENSGLLPRELPPEVLASLAGAFQSEPMIHELQEMYARLLAFAAPAPAGSLPEQGAGLADAEELDRCERILTDCTCIPDYKERDLTDPTCYACNDGVEVIDTFRALRALARQQSRGVDEAMIERACSAYNDAAVAEGFTSASESAFDLMKGWMELALRAALEGGRDGR